ncbi:MAG: Gfo/Idh/MocA family oxidoreductase [Puniceicoccales bacterium]|nr:Gfo/Idh/MocA family oxidoreductase [Puniceicoccales bacterium]
MKNKQSSRREFLSTNCSALAGLALLGSMPSNAFAAGASDRIKVGIVGVGGRGRGAVSECLQADPAVQLWAIGELFQDRLNRARDSYAGNERTKVPNERCFAGFDSYKKVIDSGVDIVLLTTPPNFRPAHMEYAIEKGVHIFAEKPIAVDVVGARKVLALGELATKKKISIVAGTQRRHQASYLERIKRIHAGEIGEIVGGQCYAVFPWERGLGARPDGMSEMEFQIRRWGNFLWLYGDIIVEQHVHNLDIINWAIGSPPVKAFGMGGRQKGTGGNIWDHFAVEYEYANGARVSSFTRHVANSSSRFSERIVGTKGIADTRGIFNGANLRSPAIDAVNPYVQEHIDLIQAVRNRKPVNDTRAIAEATLTAILGRVSSYTGKEVSYKWLLEASKEDLSPAVLDLTAPPPDHKVAVPGVTKLV